MKLFNTIMKLAAAIAAIAGIAFLVVKYMDAIKAWLSKLCPCCDVELEDDFDVEVEFVAEGDEEPVEEVIVEEAVAEEAPVVEEPEAPVADEADFEA
jgi:hypothetical protein